MWSSTKSVVKLCAVQVLDCTSTVFVIYLLPSVFELLYSSLAPPHPMTRSLKGNHRIYPGNWTWHMSLQACWLVLMSATAVWQYSVSLAKCSVADGSVASVCVYIWHMFMPCGHHGFIYVYVQYLRVLYTSSSACGTVLKVCVARRCCETLCVCLCIIVNQPVFCLMVWWCDLLWPSRRIT